MKQWLLATGRPEQPVRLSPAARVAVAGRDATVRSG
jgi:hypothetical protein